MKLHLAVLSVTALLTSVASAQGVRSKVGSALPNFSLKDISGRTHTNASLRGKVVLLDFWATWCVPCRKASPTMQRLHKTYAARGLMVIGANAYENTSGKPSGKAPAAKYAKDHGYTYPFTYDSDALAQALGVRGLPVFVLADRTGKILKVWVSFNQKTTPAEVEASVKAAMAAR